MELTVVENPRHGVPSPATEAITSDIRPELPVCLFSQASGPERAVDLAFGTAAMTVERTVSQSPGALANSGDRALAADAMALGVEAVISPRPKSVLAQPAQDRAATRIAAAYWLLRL